jgi:23S rRNA C2498 (ribose-2'-O)-methylase RlmM
MCRCVSVGWLVGWLVDGLVDGLVGWLVDWLCREWVFALKEVERHYRETRGNALTAVLENVQN